MYVESFSSGEKPVPTPAARPLIPLVIALASGVVGAAWGLRLSTPFQIAGLMGLFAGLILMWLTNRNARLIPLALFWLLGLALARQALHPVFPPHHVTHLPQEQEVSLKGRLYLPPRVQEGRVRLVMEAEAWRSPHGWRQTAGKVLLTADSHTDRPPEGGEVIVRTALRAFRDSLNPGTFRRSRYWASQAVFREGRLREAGDLIVLASTKPPGIREHLREGLRRLLGAMDPVCRALYLALILGDQGEISQDMRRDFSRTGTSHLLAISGLHLGMLAGLSFLVAFWLLRRFPWVLLRINALKVATALAAGPVVAYAWIAGGSPSTQRAEIMILSYLLLVLLGRPREGPGALALAALVILALSPLLLFSLAFQLSFVSVAALIYFLPRWMTPSEPEMLALSQLKKRAARVVFWTRGALLTSLVATLATAPLVAASFHQVSTLGVLVNLAAIPLVNGVAVPLGLLALTAESLHLSYIAHVLLNLGQIPLKLAYAVISWGAGLSWSAVIFPTPTWLQIGLFYTLALLVFPPRRTVRTWAAAGLAGALLATSVAAPQDFRSPDCELTVLDSSVGLSAVMVTSDGRRLVLSAGWPVWPGWKGRAMGPLPEHLHWRQFRRLDLVLALSLTSRSAPELLRTAQEFSLQEAWFAGGDRGEEIIALRNFLGDQNRPARFLRSGEAPPALGAAGIAYYQLEKGGMALGLTCAGQQLAIFPPAGFDSAPIDHMAAQGPLAALVVPRRPPPEWLTAIDPGCVVVIYGHPEKSQLGSRTPALERFFSTREGAISLRWTRQGLTVNQWRPWGWQGG